MKRHRNHRSTCAAGPAAARSRGASSARFVVLAAGACAAATGCNSNTLEAPKPLPVMETVVRDVVNPIRDLDILFMIDNSNSMREEQDNLRMNFPVFMQVLKDIDGGLPNVHVGVVSSDVGAGNFIIPGNAPCSRPGGDRGRLIAPAECGLAAGARYIIARENGQMTNFPGRQLEDVFSCMANLGVGGCGYEHQLRSTVLALYGGKTQPEGPAAETNAGFLRDDAYLAIVYLTDEDDCSAPPMTDFFVDPQFDMNQQASLRCSRVGHRCAGQPFPLPAAELQTPLDGCSPDPDGGGRLLRVQDMVNQIKALKPGKEDKIVVSAIIGWPTARDTSNVQYAIAPRDGRLDNVPICTYQAGGGATVGLRMKAFVEAFGENGLFESICQDNYAPALRRIAQLIANRFVSGCVPALLLDKDKDASNGHQPDCQVVEQVPNPQTGMRDDRIIDQRCNNEANPAASTNKPCFTLAQVTQQNNQECRSADARWRARVWRDGDPERDTLQVVRCQTCARDNPTAPEVMAGLCR